MNRPSTAPRSSEDTSFVIRKFGIRHSSGLGLPGLLLLIVCVLTLASLGAMAYLQFKIWGLLIFALIVAGLIIIGLLFYLFFRWLSMRKAAKFEQQLTASTMAGGSSTDPAEISRREELRDKFKSGLKTLTDSGKNLTRFPLYVMVGEPGAGKTEAIRHSSIRFPQGINDLLQGVGGTYNMDWWFTNDAIILDTAGALLLEQSNKAQFEEFLDQLKHYRPDYPITGLVLAIPADSLLIDDPRHLEEKAGRIVEQFAVLQESLDLRYPVYVMVTKCDLITGFREFFDAPGNEAFEPQMLGWSNPDPLDHAFEPSRTASVLNPLADRLQRVRDRLLGANWPSGPELRRLDFLDSVYAFPGEFRRLFSPLGKYLEILFHSDRWKNKRPPFFRGIYFTSSLRQGAVLDKELASALNLPLSRLPEVRGYQTEKSMFLRDFFLEKLFRENGLVTRLTNIGRGLRNRLMRFYLITSSVLLLLLLTGWYASRQLDKRLAAERNLWNLANQTWDNGTFLPLFDHGGPEGAWRYAGDQPVMNSEFTRVAYHQKLSSEVEKGLGWGRYFAPLPAYRQLSHDRERARIVILEGSIIRPLLQAARENLLKTPRTIGTTDQVAATVSLVELEACINENRAIASQEDVARIFGPIYRVAAPVTFGSEGKQAEASAAIEKELNRLIAEAWSEVDSGDLDRMRWMAEGPPYRALSRGMNLFTKHKITIDNQQAENDGQSQRREKLASDLMVYEDELWLGLQAGDDFKKLEQSLAGMEDAGKALDEITGPVASSMRRVDYAKFDSRLRDLLPKVPSLLATELGRFLEVVGKADPVWASLEGKQRSFDPESPKAILWAAYLDAADDGTAHYRKRLDALLQHYPLRAPDHELVRQFQAPQPGQLQVMLDALAKRVDDRSKVIPGYPEAPKLPEEKPDAAADPAKVRARAEAARKLQLRLNELGERGKRLTLDFDLGTKEWLHSKYLDGPFAEALKAQQGLIFRAPFGRSSPALPPGPEFSRAAQIISLLAGDFASCDNLFAGSRHYKLKESLSPLRLDLLNPKPNRRARFDVIAKAKAAVADDGFGVVSVEAQIGAFLIPAVVKQDRDWQLMPPFVKQKETIIAQGIRNVKVGKPPGELQAKPAGQRVPIGPLSLADPIKVTVEWEAAQGMPSSSVGEGGAWGTLDFIVGRSGNNASAIREIPVLTAFGQQLTLLFTFPSPYPVSRPSSFDN
ncbi:type VI secretion protein IcmF/TssM N-terminal domain-containing protein [Luteolibacter sp. Populi]|uniref:type VI secretion protein IcmF/TssM N-terminal domain-containing protein n=1 Tax=Luteolibacter sp. Populi TaxID=3230487 RepID=UPI003465E062